ncbi:MAG: hypothetical protein LBT60_04925 [Oscillospiraceae bacterium]|jgi:hypothetical protein|nr:hypothetical protein [Oscillospiraceae bacterium]
MNAIPTSSDIYLEVNGTRVAVVQNYAARTTRKSRPVEAFGEEEPVASIGGQRTHALTLSRLYATEAALADGLNFHDLEDFSLVVCKPDRKIIYTGCHWDDISEKGAVGDMILESVSLVATRRLETPN